MGFSLIGTLIAMVILAPSLLMIKFPPDHVPSGLKDAGIVYTLLERVGQLGCIAILAISKDNFENVEFGIWAALIFVFITIYYGLWIRYMVKGQQFRLLWAPLLFLPIPMAVLPVCAFGFAAIWGRSFWLGIAVICLAIGHFANSWHSYQYSKGQ
ncbi:MULTISPECIES: hypothetical protein [Paenibacillus]|uniref:Uncharacterized protein n=1 Tax=Paenibacillus odorifer TaxID=189426 RepID=A0A1R0WZG4_9BACL|nr:MULTISPECIES: hypothetical protein [Paenibacillus]MDH6429124.1 hypothetical protein [Paenibacillus sp. PastH-4]MDH6445330.1 hypothetical protein [Paenibacillus sp. PastF-4]MDH6529219.1 hypothetical protein [Paenibacillus sp. PastH-3]OMC64732.1 hypothetical protein BK125_30105 [Paenibacillus odorifer]OMC95533.1 hypothetical protein BJP46_29525 [Paenibacillus odorifer]